MYTSGTTAVLPRLLAGDLTGCIVQSCGSGEDLQDAAAGLRWTRSMINVRHVARRRKG